MPVRFGQHQKEIGDDQLGRGRRRRFSSGCCRCCLLRLSSICCIWFVSDDTRCQLDLFQMRKLGAAATREPTACVVTGKWPNASEPSLILSLLLHHLHPPLLRIVINNASLHSPFFAGFQPFFLFFFKLYYYCWSRFQCLYDDMIWRRRVNQKSMEETEYQELLLEKKKRKDDRE